MKYLFTFKVQVTVELPDDPEARKLSCLLHEPLVAGIIGILDPHADDPMVFDSKIRNTSRPDQVVHGMHTEVTHDSDETVQVTTDPVSIAKKQWKTEALKRVRAMQRILVPVKEEVHIPDPPTDFLGDEEDDGDEPSPPSPPYPKFTAEMFKEAAKDIGQSNPQTPVIGAVRTGDCVIEVGPADDRGWIKVCPRCGSKIVYEAAYHHQYMCSNPACTVKIIYGDCIIYNEERDGDLLEVCRDMTGVTIWERTMRKANHGR